MLFKCRSHKASHTLFSKGLLDKLILRFIYIYIQTPLMSKFVPRLLWLLHRAVSLFTNCADLCCTGVCGYMGACSFLLGS